MNATTKHIHGNIETRERPRNAVDVTPVPCDLKKGDIVTYTNENGVSFPGKEISGFSAVVESWGGFVYLFKTAFWFPVPAKSLKLEKVIAK